MDGRDMTEGKLRNLQERFHSGALSRRQFVEAAGLLLGATGLATLGDVGILPRAVHAAAPTRTPLLKVGFWSEPGVLDPVFTTRYQTLDVVCNFFEGLFADGAKYSPQPMLAASYEASKDGKLVTIGLRKGVTFHNGKEMTSADVLASLKRWAAIGANGTIAAKRIDQIKARDKHTITVAFNKATGLFPTYLALPDASIMPE